MLLLTFGIDRYAVWKNTHISVISNYVTHLQSYTNTAIAGNSALI